MYVASNKLSYCIINAKGYKHKKDKAITLVLSQKLQTLYLKYKALRSVFSSLG